MIDENQLKKSMHILLEELLNASDKNSYVKILAKAVQLGMKYQQAQIKAGIDIVFEELNKNNTSNK